jgi:putative hydrolase of the HAD superfamily
MGAVPGETLFIDDYPYYVQGFIDMGGHGLLLDENDVHSHYPHEKIQNLQEIKKYL